MEMSLNLQPRGGTRLNINSHLSPIMPFFHTTTVNKVKFGIIFLGIMLVVPENVVPLHTQTRNNDGAIAQLVEQRTENPCVPGSIPGGTTKESS